MKSLIMSVLMLSTVSVTQAAAETWTWAPIRDGSTLNAHLANFESIRPKTLLVFQLIASISERTVEAHKSSS